MGLDSKDGLIGILGLTAAGLYIWSKYKGSGAEAAVKKIPGFPGWLGGTSLPAGSGLFDLGAYTANLVNPFRLQTRMAQATSSFLMDNHPTAMKTAVKESVSLLTPVPVKAGIGLFNWFNDHRTLGITQSHGPPQTTGAPFVAPAVKSLPSGTNAFNAGMSPFNPFAPNAYARAETATQGGGTPVSVARATPVASVLRAPRSGSVGSSGGSSITRQGGSGIGENDVRIIVRGGGGGHSVKSSHIARKHHGGTGSAHIIHRS